MSGPLALFVVNKSGGLIYSRPLSPSAQRLDTNDAMRLASLWHSLHAISAQLSPNPSSSGGMELLEANTFDLHCFTVSVRPLQTFLILILLIFATAHVTS